MAAYRSEQGWWCCRPSHLDGAAFTRALLQVGWYDDREIPRRPRNVATSSVGEGPASNPARDQAINIPSFVADGVKSRTSTVTFDRVGAPQQTERDHIDRAGDQHDGYFGSYFR